MKKFLLSTGLVLGLEAAFYWIVKIFQYNYNTFYLNVDYTIPFINYFVYIYDLFYPFTFLCLFIMYKHDKKVYKNALIGLTIGFIICCIMFIIYPTIMIRPDVKVDSFTNFVLYVTYKADTPAINCFPSIHCLFMFQMIFSISKISINKYKKLSLIIFAILVILSTLFIKQHYVMDVLVSFIICLMINLIIKYKTSNN